MQKIEETMGIDSGSMLESIQDWVEQLLEQSDTTEKISEYNKILESIQKLRG